MSLPSASEEQALALEQPAVTPWAVNTEDLSVVYRTHFDKKPTLAKSLRRLGRRERIVRQIRALRGVSIDVPRGEVLGIIGVNGAGKSTLMRTIAGILPPTQGRVKVRGRVSTLLALGIGFHGGLSGRENVYLGGLAAGLTREEVAAKYDDIAEFAELGPDAGKHRFDAASAQLGCCARELGGGVRLDRGGGGQVHQH